MQTAKNIGARSSRSAGPRAAAPRASHSRRVRAPIARAELQATPTRSFDAPAPSDSDAAGASPIAPAPLPEPAAAPVAGRCPVLSALSPPPASAVPWFRRMMQFTNPPKFQEELLGAGHAIVSTPAQMGFPAMVVPGNPDDIRMLMAREGDLANLMPTLSLGDLIDSSKTGSQSEAAHKNFRAMLQPAFTPEAINGQFLPEVVSIVDGALRAWAAKGEAVPGYDAFKRMTFEIIIKVMMGKAYAEAELSALHRDFTAFTGGMGSWPQLNVPFTAYGKAMAARNRLVTALYGDVLAARAQMEAGEEVPGQLGVMLRWKDENGNPFNNDRITETLLALLFAGHDTTSTSLTQLLPLLEAHPEVVAKLREEQRRLVEKHGPGVTLAHMRGMAYADAVIRESLRIRPVAMELYRRAAKDFELGGHAVPAGTAIAIPMAYVSAHDPRWAGATGDLAPEVFNPDRMLRPEGRAPGDQMPFGYGPRYCLGAYLAQAEMKAFLALYAQRYSATCDPTTEWHYTVGRTPKNGLPTLMRELPPSAMVA